MALFSRTPKAKKEETQAVAPVASKPVSALVTSSVLIKPHITEKAGLLSQKGVYTFEVRQDATEASVVRAVALAYKVAPIRASFAPIRSKKIFARGRRGEMGGGKKAYVYLPKGQTIEFI